MTYANTLDSLQLVQVQNGRFFIYHDFILTFHYLSVLLYTLCKVRLVYFRSFIFRFLFYCLIYVFNHVSLVRFICCFVCFS